MIHGDVATSRDGGSSCPVVPVKYAFVNQQRTRYPVMLKANAAEVLTQIAEQRVPMVITQNGEAKAVLQDVASFEETQETLALLKILALGHQDVAAGKVKPMTDVVARLRARRASV